MLPFKDTPDGDDVIYTTDMDDNAPTYSIINSIHLDSCVSCLQSRG